MEDGYGGVLVIGGGAAGCAAASELSRRGAAVTVVESAERLGGLAATHCCKSTDRCERCDACLPYDIQRRVRAAEAITVLTSSNLIDAEVNGNGVMVRISTPRGEVNGRFGAVIVSIGAPAFDPSLDPRLGYGTVNGVLSSLDIDRSVRAGTFTVPDGTAMAIVQCVGSRDEKHGAPYCSKACCKYALKLARHLQTTWTDLDITYFHMDWRPLDGDLSALSRWEGDGTRVVRSRPAEILEKEGRPLVRYADPADGPREEAFDLVMLTVGLMPPANGPSLATMLEIPLDDLGFFFPAQGRVLAAGCCTGPKDIDESVKEGIATAGRALTIMEGR